MQKAAFSIENYIFDQVEIDLEKYNNKEDLKIDFQPTGFYDGHKKIFEIIFEVKVYEEGEDRSFVRIRCKGMFSFLNISSFEDIPKFFYANSIAILFPYIRAYISLVTTQANVPGIILPTLNLSKLEDRLRNNTSQK